MKTTANPSRRTFLKATAALSGGLVIAFTVFAVLLALLIIGSDYTHRPGNRLQAG